MTLSSYLADNPALTSEDKVLILYTGGTIGMTHAAQGLTPGGDFAARLARAFATLPPSRQMRLPPFEVVSYAQLIDSSAATPLMWQRLGEDVAARLRAYCGVVIVHGTDTLSFTASSLAYQLQGVDRPVIVTGAMQPLEAPCSDGLANLEGALHFAAKAELQEVALYFANRLLRGVRSLKHHCNDPEAFASPSYPPLGERVGDDFVLYPQRGLICQQRGAPRFELVDYAPLAAGGVVRVALWPGISAWQLQAWLEDDRVKGALLEVWGAGNVPDDPALLAVLAKANGEGKLLAAVSQCRQGSVHLGAYAAGQGLNDAGALSGGDMTVEAAYTKLVHLLAQPLAPADRREQFLTALVGER
ncbi:asparaginase [Halomonas dongshanensis]|uniref:Asparaginase n=1 Tax=Halomonas dongshanensis TaxID=2890835 RepID=A0ABT2EFE3_9GAMM|nr:asparaginase [Halomonas dongshanensis]MCS2610209.1 asparaginase [Halomonas dongshanensis]